MRRHEFFLFSGFDSDIRLNDSVVLRNKEKENKMNRDTTVKRRRRKTKNTRTRGRIDSTERGQVAGQSVSNSTSQTSNSTKSHQSELLMRQSPSLSPPSLSYLGQTLTSQTSKSSRQRRRPTENNIQVAQLPVVVVVVIIIIIYRALSSEVHCGL